METDRVELMLFPEYSTLVSAERNLEEYPLFELKARQRGSKARLFERVIEGEGWVSLLTDPALPAVLVPTRPVHVGFAGVFCVSAIAWGWALFRRLP